MTEAAVVARPREREIGRELRLCSGWFERAGVAALLGLVVAVPLLVSSSFWISILSFAGIAAIAAVGLNLLTGYAGELSIGHAFFVAVGAYSAVYVGSTHGQPLLVWLLACAAFGALAGAVVTPLALRIRGFYFIVVTIGLVFFGIYLFNNWNSLTGGSNGIGATLELKIGPLDFGGKLFGHTFQRQQTLCLLIWLLVVLSMLLVKNISRSRAGRAMQAMRDNDLAAEVVGVSALRVKAAAFIVSSALAGVAGGLLAATIQYVTPEQFNLDLSLQYLSILIVGGMASTYGPVLGALLVGGLPQLIDRFGSSLPFVKASDELGGGWGFTQAQFVVFSYGALLVIFLIAEPRGLAELVARAWRSVRRLGASRVPRARRAGG